MSSTLNASEKELLQYWLADQAPGFNPKAPLSQAGMMNAASLKATDFVAISQLDNDVLRGYLSQYQTQKLAEIANNISRLTNSLSRTQSNLSTAQADSAAISGLVVQAVPTS